ncbi:hypothetical protein GQ600_10368 [Phytophthora cactorum]|nr:hypothetical protein GQ600_10368 [Phytophthora cactorum]
MAKALAFSALLDGDALCACRHVRGCGGGARHCYPSRLSPHRSHWSSLRTPSSCGRHSILQHTNQISQLGIRYSEERLTVGASASKVLVVHGALIESHVWSRLQFYTIDWSCAGGWRRRHHLSRHFLSRSAHSFEVVEVEADRFNCRGSTLGTALPWTSHACACRRTQRRARTCASQCYGRRAGCRVCTRSLGPCHPARPPAERYRVEA